MKRIAAVAAMAVVLAGALATTLTPAWGAGTVVDLSVDKVMVNKTGGITAMGTVDCAAEVALAWPGPEGPPPGIWINVSWTAHQRQGRQLITASLVDTMASPCWTNHPDLGEGCDLDPGVLPGPDDDTYHPCRWDSGNYGSDGYQYGNGAFKVGLVHLDTTLQAGDWGDPDEGETFDFFQRAGWDVRATKG